MANPQPDDAHLRTAHSINEAIMMRDFTKRQRKILDLILRLSWGCGKKEAYIPHQNDFCIVGIYEPDIKQELTWLELSNIIIHKESFYWFNKDFDQWQISRVKPFEPERLSKLLSINLSVDRPQLSETLSADLVKHEVNTSQNTKSPTSETNTPKERLKKVLKKDIYIAYPEFKNVDKMTEVEHIKLIERFGEERTKDMVENLSLYIASKGDKYKDHYATILSWEKKDRREVSRGENRRHNGARGLPQTYRTPEQIFGDKDV